MLFRWGDGGGDRGRGGRPAWALACQRARVAGLHFHDLRREFACRLLESSADLHDVRDFLGHANITTTSRYLQSTPARLERVQARMEEAVSAHGSHTDAKQPLPETPEGTSEKRPT